jgi:hypothetical protein
MTQTTEQHPTELSNLGHFANLRIMKQELEAQVADFGKSLTLLEELPKKLSHKIQVSLFDPNPRRRSTKSALLRVKLCVPMKFSSKSETI